jgi:glycosyltransferase involved in cell wall biosynthesis
MLKEKLKQSTFVTTCTAYKRQYLLEQVLGGNGSNISSFAEKIIVNYHGVDFSKFNGAPIPKKNRPFTILSVGTLNKTKGFEYLIDACKILKEKNIDFRCIIAGGGYLDKELKGRVADYNLSSSVLFTGYISQEELIPYYKEADLFVLAAVLEIHWGIPNVLLEASAAKLPIMCTKLPAVFNELIEDMETGVIIPNKDPQGIAGKIELLYRDSKLANKLAINGYRKIEERFDICKNVKQLIEVFNQRIKK